jgi:hypothetical protein
MQVGAGTEVDLAVDDDLPRLCGCDLNKIFS